MSSSYHWHLPPASNGGNVVKLPWKTSTMTTTTAATTVRHHGSNENLGKYLNSNFLIKWSACLPTSLQLWQIQVGGKKGKRDLKVGLLSFFPKEVELKKWLLRKFKVT